MHSIFSDGLLQKHCSFLVEWATRTATLEAKETAVAEKALNLKTYVAACGVVPRVKQDEGAVEGFQAKVFGAAWAVKELFDRMTILQDAVLFTALVKGELAADCMKHLPENLAAFATVLNTDWEKELEALQVRRQTCWVSSRSCFCMKPHMLLHLETLSCTAKKQSFWQMSRENA